MKRTRTAGVDQQETNEEKSYKILYAAGLTEPEKAGRKRLFGE